MTVFALDTKNEAFTGEAILAAVLHPNEAARNEALRRGRERLAGGRSLAEAFAANAAGARRRASVA